MSLVRWNPLKELNNLRRQMDSLFEEIVHRRPGNKTDVDNWFGFDLLPDSSDLTWSPVIDFKETDNELILKAELPGIEAKDIDLQVSSDRVSIAGERQAEKHEEKKGCSYSEFSYGRFQRIFSLPTSIDKDNVKADFKNGLLTLSLPKDRTAIPSAVKINLVEDKAREAMTEQRQNEERQEEKMHSRTMEEVNN
jgi:HSP20 family protein